MNLNINTGEVKLTINDDPSRVLKFFPGDVGFVERFYGLIRDFDKKSDEFMAQARELDNAKAVDVHGVPVNAKDYMILLRNICTYFREQIDTVFGAGSSSAVFGDVNDLEVIAQFFEAITPYIQKAREDKVQKYIAPNRAQRRTAAKRK